MEGNQILLLGLGMDKQPHELHLEVKADRGAKYACPVCGTLAYYALHQLRLGSYR